MKGSGYRRIRPAAAVLILAPLILLMSVRPAGALSYEDEREMGQAIFASLKKHVRFIDDPAVTSYVNALGRKILRPIGPQPFDYRFFVIQSETINAFATPAGYVYISSGALASLETEGHLASIIGHEIAHSVKRHIAKRIAKNQKMTWATLGGLIAGALIGGAPGAAVAMGSVAANMQAQLAYSREDEREADRLGLDYIVKAGYSSRDMVEAFQTMIQVSYHVPEGIPTYLRTHPALPERVAAMEAIEARKGQQRVRTGDDETFTAVRNRVLAMYSDTVRARNHFQAMLKKNPDDPSAYHGLALLYQRERQYDRAVSEMNRGLKIAPNNAAMLTDLGDLHFNNKNMAEARTILEKAKNISPRSIRTLYLLGRTYEELGQEEKARLMYERTLVQDPDHEETLYKLGILYGRKGDLARAHYTTGRYFKVRGEKKKSLYHFQQAKANSASAPADLKRRIDAELKALEKKPGD